MTSELARSTSLESGTCEVHSLAVSMREALKFGYNEEEVLRAKTDPGQIKQHCSGGIGTLTPCLRAAFEVVDLRAILGYHLKLRIQMPLTPDGLRPCVASGVACPHHRVGSNPVRWCARSSRDSLWAGYMINLS